MTASVAGSLILVLAAAAFLYAAIHQWRCLGESGSSRASGITGVAIDLLVGIAGIGDGVVSVLGEPKRVVVWSVGSLALVIAATVLLVRHRRDQDKDGWHPGRS